MKLDKAKILSAINVPRHVCDVALGKDHPIHHRMIAGTIMMAFGVGISKAFVGVHVFFISEIFDGVGYLIHGVGTIPFAEWLSAMFKRNGETPPNP